MVFYDIRPPRRGTSRSSVLTECCGVCKQRSAFVYTLTRGPEDESDDVDYEEIAACPRCIVDAMLDGIRP